MDERTDAKRSIESSTKHLTRIAHELSRRASPRYIGDQAKETALNKTNEWKEQIGMSPLALGLIGGTIGALLGRALAKERRTQAYGLPDLRYRTAMADDRGVRYGGLADVRGVAYGSDAGWNDGNGDSGRSVGEKIGERAQDLKDKASDLVANVRDRLPSPGEMAANVRDHIPSASLVSQKADENPMLVALGGLALGAVAALLLPVSQTERELLDPVKQRAGEAMGSLGGKIGDTVQQARDSIAGQPHEQQSPRPGEFIESGIPSLPH